MEALHKKIRYLRISGARAMGQEVNLEDVLKKYVSKLNKHCEILVSCSDEERNYMQACVTACKLRELHASSCNCMKACVTAIKLRELHASSGNCMQAHVTACKLM